MSCEHYLFFTSPIPVVGETLYCHHCREAKDITKVLDEYRIRCTKCRYGRTFGQAEMSAQVFAAKHALTRHHTVNVFLGTKVLRSVDVDTPQLELTEEPPF